MDQVALPKRRDRTRDNLVRAVLRTLRRCDQLSRRYGADVYVLVRWQNKHYEYCSTDEAAFPIRPIDLVSSMEIRHATGS